MSENFENELRRALRPLDAPAGFTEKVMRSLPATREPAPAEPRAERPRSFAQRFGIPAAFAAALVASVLLGQQVAQQRETLAQRRAAEAGRAASAELMQALRITSQKLDIAYEAMNEPRAQSAEENPS